MSKPDSFSATKSVLERLNLNKANRCLADGCEPASDAAVIFSAIVQARATERLVAAVEKNTRAIMLANGRSPDDARLSEGSRS